MNNAVNEACIVKLMNKIIIIKIINIYKAAIEVINVLFVQQMKSNRIYVI